MRRELLTAIRDGRADSPACRRLRPRSAATREDNWTGRRLRAVSRRAAARTRRNGRGLPRRPRRRPVPQGGRDQDAQVRTRERSAIARFRHERQILARLEHPNIARLLDGGTREQGTPYIVIEYITSISITEWCDERKASIEDRLRLFRLVCDAGCGTFAPSISSCIAISSQRTS